MTFDNTRKMFAYKNRLVIYYTQNGFMYNKILRVQAFVYQNNVLTAFDSIEAINQHRMSTIVPDNYISVSPMLTKIHLRFRHNITGRITHLFRSLNYEAMESTVIELRDYDRYQETTRNVKMDNRAQYYLGDWFLLIRNDTSQYQPSNGSASNNMSNSNNSTSRTFYF